MNRVMEEPALAKILKHNSSIRVQNEVLKCCLAHLKCQPHQEYSGLLDCLAGLCKGEMEAALRRGFQRRPQPEVPYCCRTPCGNPCPPGSCECRPDRVAAGCSKGGCGGYTPSGWNKLMSRRHMDMACCCPRPDDLTPCCKRTKDGAAMCDTVSCHAGVADCLNRPSVRILGELAFQLERRILDYVFGNECCKQARVYGYTVNCIYLMLEKECAGTCASPEMVNMACRMRKILCGLATCGYNLKCHSDFAQEIINKYGVLPHPPSQCTIQMFGLNDVCAISCLINKLSRTPTETHNLNILLNSLKFIANCDGRPLFVW